MRSEIDMPDSEIDNAIDAIILRLFPTEAHLDAFVDEIIQEMYERDAGKEQQQ